ncbi:hypothetical protein Dimus_037988 [Dionaea muscipula]
MFKMLPNESISDMFGRFTNIINPLDILGKTYSNEEKVRKLLRCLSKDWRPKVTVIEEAKDLIELTIEQLLGSLMAHEMNLKGDSIMEEDRKKRTIAFKTSTSKEEKRSKDEKKEKEESSDDESSDDEDIALLSRKLKKLIRSRKAKDGRFTRKFERKKYHKKDSSSDEDNKKKKDEIICYGCKKPRHIKSECPKEKVKKKYFKGKKKSFMATWYVSEDDSSSDESKQEEKANICLMAREDEENEDLEVDFDPIDVDELLDAVVIMHDKNRKLKSKNAILLLDIDSLTHDKDAIQSELDALRLNSKNIIEKDDFVFDEIEMLTSSLHTMTCERDILPDKMNEHVASLTMTIDTLEKEKESALKKQGMLELKIKALINEKNSLHERVINFEKKVDKFNKGTKLLIIF